MYSKLYNLELNLLIDLDPMEQSVMNCTTSFIVFKFTLRFYEGHILQDKMSDQKVLHLNTNGLKLRDKFRL